MLEDSLDGGPQRRFAITSWRFLIMRMVSSCGLDKLSKVIAVSSETRSPAA